MLSKNQIKLIKGLSLKKNRIQHQLFTVEGTKGIFEILNSHFVCEALYTTDPELFKGFDPITVSHSNLKRISQLKNPSQSLAVFRIPESEFNGDEQLVLALDDIKDPGNLGTIIRLCDWFGVYDIVCTQETVDCYNSKVVQATMGSLARVRVHYLDLRSFLLNYTGMIYGTFLEGDSAYSTPLKEPAVLVMGNESRGISDDLKDYISKRITIPQFGLKGNTESLNVASATAICLSEFRRLT